MEHGMVDKCEVIVKIEHDIEIRNGVMGKPCNIEYMEKNEHADIAWGKFSFVLLDNALLLPKCPTGTSGATSNCCHQSHNPSNNK